MNSLNGLPREKLAFKKKDREWRKKHLDWADNYTFRYGSVVRKSYEKKLINYNLINGKLNMEDVEIILNPNNIDAGFIPDEIQHYPIINPKLNVIRGEESKRRFDYRVIVTNPEAISEIEVNRKVLLMNSLEEWATADSMNEEEQERDLEKIYTYYKYSWQDMREVRANALIKHYFKELSFSKKFNEGIMDLMVAGEEAFMCDVVGGEPTMEKINTLKMEVIQSGYSTNFEDADKIILWDYWSPAKIIDTYYDVLTQEDQDTIENMPFAAQSDDRDIIDDSKKFLFADPLGSVYGEGALIEGFLFSNTAPFSANYTDNRGNIRIIRFYWKSKRPVLLVRSYDPESGDEIQDFYPESYIPDDSMGEEIVGKYWINEAWEGTKIAKSIYVNMRPRLVQYNRLSNPSRCHFGIVGSVASFNESKPFSLVDMGKPYNYYYDVIHDRLNKNLAANWGKIAKLDLANIPKGWTIEKWFYYAKVNKIAVVDSFKEGNAGAARGKLAGHLNNQSSGHIDADLGNIIQNDINLLEFIKMEMSEVMGITPQREGQVANRETVGGVERSVLQSSHITEWLFTIHDNVKKRVVECFLETAKAALKGRSKKFQSILNDGSLQIMEIDGDEFAECDYGLVVEDSDQTQDAIDKISGLAQALVQNQAISVSTLMSIWTDSNSIASIRRSIEEDERAMQERAAEVQEAQAQQVQAEIESKQYIEERKLTIQEDNNIRDNETKLLMKEIDLMIMEGRAPETDEEYNLQKKEELLEKIRQHNDKMKLERDKLTAQIKQQSKENSFKQQEISIKNKQTNKINK